RVLPRLNEDINEEWISDKTRFACDGLRRQRLDRPYVRVDGRLRPAGWSQAFAAIKDRISGCGGGEIAAIAGDLACCESMVALKDLLTALGSPHLDCRQDGAALDAGTRASYLFNSTIAGIDQADAILLVGTNPRVEAPIVNARIRARFLTGQVQIAAIGPDADLTYEHQSLGNDPQLLQKILAGKHAFAKVLADAKRPMLVLGMGALARADGGAILGLAREIADKYGLIDEAGGWNGFNVLHTAASRVGGLDVGFVPGEGGRDTSGICEGAASGAIKVLFLLGADEVDTQALGSAFVVYLGHHGDAGAQRADVVLPGAAYTEKSGTYVNTEGRVQHGRRAVQPPGEAREDWKILRALSEALGHALPYDTLDQVRARLGEVNAVFSDIGVVRPASWSAFGTSGTPSVSPFASPITNFYMTNAVCRASETMAECARALQPSNERKTGTHG
ncbi:MAG: molybdopterin-dependent oxidoreductase, partial [Rhodospirillales bacterium]|nr:molybdopterin-dependent oxidoreductase [Rhodospirillales bacterium]